MSGLRIIGGEFKGRILKSPKTDTTRPTQSMVREALFNICQNKIAGAYFLDLFAGSGAIGFEALSRGASKVYFAENNRNASQCIRENIELLHVEEKATLYPVDYRVALKNLQKKGESFDLIYIDPPYHKPVEPILEELIEFSVVKPGGLVFVEQRSIHGKPYESPHYKSLDSRRFGEALLQQYLYSGES